ncbi:hypothetical protein GCM10010383_08880 [Streptomyces lomondensis]|uniref:Uncharacterized protein n=1 Tax=Streptomyces lomondensis TaxID=68229 RepID=A0ABQ2WVY8_9ACTN|nr:hypothetical protein GCM10010383_08880 [Streptomyces lomondensis]
MRASLALMVICGTPLWYWKTVRQWYGFLVQVADWDVSDGPDRIRRAVAGRPPVDRSVWRQVYSARGSKRLPGGRTLPARVGGGPPSLWSVGFAVVGRPDRQRTSRTIEDKRWPRPPDGERDL